MVRALQPDPDNGRAADETGFLPGLHRRKPCGNRRRNLLLLNHNTFGHCPPPREVLPLQATGRNQHTSGTGALINEAVSTSPH